MLQRLFKLGIIIGLGAVVIYGFWPTPPTIEVTPAAVKPLTIVVNEEGKTRVIDRFVMFSPVSGYLRRIQLDVGDVIAQDEIVAELEPLKSDILDPRTRAESEARVKASESALNVAIENVDAAKAELDYAQAEYDRKAKLREAKTISQEELDLSYSALRRTKANHRSAQFTVEVAKYELDAAKTALAQYSSNGQPKELVSIKAPVNGQVLKINRESEGAINVSEPILEIGDPNALEVEVDVLSIDAIKIKPGTQVNFAHWGGTQDLVGQVRLIEPVGFTKVSALGVEEQRVLVIADIISPKEEWTRLGDGYRVEANFVIWHEEEVLQVPSSSLFRAADQWALYTVKNGVTQFTPVEIGQTNGLQTQVLSGIKPGDFVVTFPESQLKSGIKVKALL